MTICGADGGIIYRDRLIQVDFCMKISVWKTPVPGTTIKSMSGAVTDFVVMRKQVLLSNVPL